jgi:hypothetical protein
VNCLMTAWHANEAELRSWLRHRLGNAVDADVAHAARERNWRRFGFGVVFMQQRPTAVACRHHVTAARFGPMRVTAWNCSRPWSASPGQTCA